MCVVKPKFRKLTETPAIRPDLPYPRQDPRGIVWPRSNPILRLSVGVIPAGHHVSIPSSNGGGAGR